MPNFQIHLVNSEYESRDGGADYDDAASAMTAGVKSALQIASDEIVGGHLTAAVEVCVKDDNGTALCRSVLALSVSPLLIPGEAALFVP